MRCEEAQLLMVPMWAKDASVTKQEKNTFETHITMCPACKSEYEETCQLMPIVKEHWGPISKDTFELLEKAGQSYKPRMTVEEGWQDLCRRCPDLAKSTEKPKSLQLFLRIGAVAVCLVIGVFAWLAFSIYLKPRVIPNSVLRQVAFSQKPYIKVELMSENGNVPISAGQEIKTSTNESKTFIINNKHRAVMNPNTTLTLEPLTENNRLGCLVKLSSGQLFTNVEHDGNPFVVGTTHGKAIIVGTTFDMKVTDNSTTLVVVEGRVKFKSEKGVIEVLAGQMSTIVGQSAPTEPVSCDANELTAWATGYKAKPALAQFESSTNQWELPLSFRKEPIVLEETDYEHWFDQKRGWFKQEFPWIFQLKEALAKEGIEADYPELLIKTGDIWQFVCLEVSPARFSVIEPNSLLNTACDYGFDKQWLLENVPLSKSALEKPVLSENSFTDLAAFERWLEYLDETKKLKPPTPIYSYHASKYLAETRSLIWFAVRDGRYNLIDQERTEVLTLLQEEVTAACECQNEELYPSDEQKAVLL